MAVEIPKEKWSGKIGELVIGATAQTWTFGTNTDLVFFFKSLTGYLAFFAAPAAGLLAIRAIWDAGKTEDIEKVIPKIPK